MHRVEARLPSGRVLELATVGPESGRPVLFCHSPAGAGGEMASAETAAHDLNLRMICIRRPSIECAKPSEFIAAVARATSELVDVLELAEVDLVGWSGGAPHTVAAAHHCHGRVSSVHLVSPLPGPLTGAEAVANQSPRLQEVAGSTAESSWITRPSALRDYQAMIGDWPVLARDVSVTTTVWSPSEDEIVPPPMLEQMTRELQNAKLVPVDGDHGWVRANWSTVLAAIAS